MSKLNVLFCSALLQSNKKKEVPPTETKNIKEQETKPFSSQSSEKARPTSSQPPQIQPPSSPSPAHGEPRRGGKGERGTKRCLKNKPCDKPSSTGVKSGGGDDATPTSKPAAVIRTDQQAHEPSAKRTISRPPKTTTTAVEATSPSPDRRTHAVKSTAANGRDSHTHPPAGRSPQTQRRDGDKAERLSKEQEHTPAPAAAPAASHSNKTQVREVTTYQSHSFIFE